MRNEIALYAHAGSGNHGCEAIVDSLVRMMPVDHFRLLSNSAEEDREYLPGEVRARVELLEEQHIDQHPVTHTLYYVRRKLTGNAEPFLAYRYRPFTGSDAPELAVSIGGDNYCYPSMMHDLMIANAMFHHQGTATVLLGCSIEPSFLGVKETAGGPETGNTQEHPDRPGLREVQADPGKSVSGWEQKSGKEKNAGNTPQDISSELRNGRHLRYSDYRGEFNPADPAERQRLLEDLFRYNKIIARESITCDALKEALGNAWGRAGEDKVVYCPDPAFTLPSDENGLPDWFEPGNTVGINISPMVQDYASSGESLLSACEEMIRYILDTTAMKVALIPHVVWERNNDLVPLRKLHEAFRGTGRVQIVEDAPAEKIKGIIANCRFFVGARTHATIAAYSTLIPTLVIGYSVKSRGIARDLFGSSPDYKESHYVLPVQTLTAEQLLDGWKWLFSHEDEIRYQLSGSATRLRAEAGRNADILHAVMQGL